jgi:hypothetical protein
MSQHFASILKGHFANRSTEQIDSFGYTAFGIKWASIVVLCYTVRQLFFRFCYN